MISGISHITFIVEDLEKATKFFKKVFDAEEVYYSGDKTFYDMYLERIQRLGLEIKEGRNRIDEEGRSIYFYDYDNHLFELHTGTLESRLLSYKERQTD
ncbi:VOC family protein [Lutispora thermophila]|uniref:Glyoxalase/Bleomycin resistance protein/Dioxygenase superfamily protein n=1 Tax=Lutispora thermophila DSM 19022 TaxID=1122184 RepID=A0A1M6HDU0_9FIRM|nr:VOC family protein [Lutispora thermophila]SHJ20304.1 Glyoxalase/Bleomycin resistance protein/Dioxygenase superfamily protein [Lutispora thermophila DSM 19022]